MAFLFLWYLFFISEIFKFSCYANLVTDDIIGCASTVVWHKIKNISANNDAVLLKPRMLYPTTYTRWFTFSCCYGNMLGSSLSSLLAEIFLILCLTTVLVQPMTSSVTRFVQWENLNNSGIRKDITKRKMPFYSTLKSLLNKRIFDMAYFSGHMHFKAFFQVKKQMYSKTHPLNKTPLSE